LLALIYEGLIQGKKNSNNNRNIQELINTQHEKYGSVEDIFILCETCHWCATFFDKSRLPTDTCPMCSNIEISSFPILPNEEFVFDYSEKRGVELDFRPRRKTG
jgi:hypothetical protein